MRICPKPKKILFTFLLLFISIGVISFPSIVHSQTQDDVQVTARVNFNPHFRLIPERRIPLVNNWGNTYKVEIRNVGSLTPISTHIMTTDAFGNGNIAQIDSSVVPAGNYDIAIKGYSHLNHVFSNQALTQSIPMFDFSSTLLLAGDSSIVEDNYINALDVANMSQKIYSTDLKNDLNRDGVVNSLDLSNISINFYKQGMP